MIDTCLFDTKVFDEVTLFFLHLLQGLVMDTIPSINGLMDFIISMRD